MSTYSVRASVSSDSSDSRATSLSSFSSAGSSIVYVEETVDENGERETVLVPVQPAATITSPTSSSSSLHHVPVR